MRWRLVGILLLTLAVRVMWLRRFPTDPIGPVDAEGFHLLAVNVLNGYGFAISWEAPFCTTAIRPPLYPLFIAASYLLLGFDPYRVVLLQILLEVLATAWVIRLGLEVGGSRAATLAGVLYALNGTTQRYTGYLLAEALLVPLMALALWQSVRVIKRPTIRRMALAGIWWGLALLIKPNVQFLSLAVGLLLSYVTFLRGRVRQRHYPAAMIPSSFLSRFRTVRAIAAFWGMLAIVVFPWILRNYLLFERPIISTAFEENLARVSAVATLAELESIPAEPWTETWEYLYGRIVATTSARYGWDARLQQQTLPCAERARHQRQIAQVGWDLVRRHPGAFLRAHFRGVGASLRDPSHALWFTVLTGRDWSTTGVVESIWRRMAWSLERGALGDALWAFWSQRIVHIPLDAALIWWGAVIARVVLWFLSLRGVWRLRYGQLWVAVLFLSTVTYLLMLPGPIAHDRFYLPAIPAVVVLSAIGRDK